MTSIAIVIGTRPEAIKMAPVIHELRNSFSDEIRVINTGQHKELLSGVLEVFGLKADASLDVMKQGQSLSSLTSRAILALEAAFSGERPELVMVHGDTSTAMAAGLAAFYEGISVAHVEAGLRTRNLRAPFPEELNRQILARLSDLNFAPTQRALENLRAESVPDEKVFMTGNTVVDSSSWVFENYLQNDAWREKTIQNIEGLGARLSEGRPYILITLHRRENHGDAFNEILSAIRDLAARNKGVSFVFPVHPNPNIRKVAGAFLSGLENVYLCDPLDYLEFSLLLQGSLFAISDSGGVQEEGVTFNTPVLVARDDTERPEGLSSGLLHLVGSQRDEILRLGQDMIDNVSTVAKYLNLDTNPFGDGLASKRIAATVQSFMSRRAG
jgi:UDP-N-acetylglucosamine 2-epimerase (non-hydrolysing)